MTAKQWKKTIEKQMNVLDIAQSSPKTFAAQVDALAGILEQRDKTFEEFQQSGGKSVIEYTNKGGSTNMTKNPLVVLWDDLNKSALAYWRELGLTPSSYRKMTGDVPKKGKPAGLAAALASLETG